MHNHSVVTAAIAPYSVPAFNALPEFDISKATFAANCHVLDMFGDIVRKHQAEKYLGAALIHKHFALLGDERVVEEVTPDGSVISPRTGTSEETVTPYLWHLGATDSPVPQWTPVEFVISETVPGNVREFARSLSSKPRLLYELATVLIEHNAQDTFGLALLHRQRVNFDRDRQVLLEAPGNDERSLEVTPVDPSATAGDDWTQTYWHFDVNAKGVVNGCSQHGCAGYCSLHK